MAGISTYLRKDINCRSTSLEQPEGAYVFTQLRLIKKPDFWRTHSLANWIKCPYCDAVPGSLIVSRKTGRYDFYKCVVCESRMKYDYISNDFVMLDEDNREIVPAVAECV